MRLTGASLCTRDGSTVTLHDVQHAWCAAQIGQELGLIQGAIRLSSHVLARDPEALPGQLIGWLLNEESRSIQVLLDRLQSTQSGTWIEPLTGSLTEPGGPLLRTLDGYSKVNAVAVTPDGQRAVSASSDRTLKVWDLASGLELRTLQGHSDSVRAVAVTLDGQRAVSAASDQTLKVWDLASGCELRTLLGHFARVAVTPDGQRAVSAASDQTLKVWDLASGAVLTHFTADAPLHAVAITLDSRAIIAGDRLGRVHFLRLHGL